MSTCFKRLVILISVDASFLQTFQALLELKDFSDLDQNQRMTERKEGQFLMNEVQRGGWETPAVACSGTLTWRGSKQELEWNLKWRLLRIRG
jgi:hypothetical protein